MRLPGGNVSARIKLSRVHPLSSAPQDMRVILVCSRRLRWRQSGHIPPSHRLFYVGVVQFGQQTSEISMLVGMGPSYKEPIATVFQSSQQ